MFRWVLLAPLILVGCEAAPASASRIVNFNGSVPEQNLALKSGCVWKQADVSIFNQKKQRVKFRYKACLNQIHNIEVMRGDNIELSLNDVMVDGFVISKQGPSSKQGFIQHLIKQGPEYKGQCEIVQTKNGWWKIIDTLPTSKKAKFNPPCGKHGRTGGLEQAIIFKNGLVLIVPTENSFIDKSSIIYENNG